MVSFFEHQKLSYKKQYIRTLVMLASSDGNLDVTEQEFIRKIGEKKGLKPWQLDNILLEKEQHQILIPESIENRLNLLFDLMSLVMNDYVIDEREKELIRFVTRKCGMKDEICYELLELFKRGVPVPEQWEEFTHSVKARV